MPKRKRTEEISSGPQAHPEPINPAQASEEGNAAAQPGLVDGFSTLGSPAATAVTDRVEGALSLDAVAKALLAAYPFLGLLLDAGYTWC